MEAQFKHLIGMMALISFAVLGGCQNNPQRPSVNDADAKVSQVREQSEMAWGTLANAAKPPASAVSAEDRKVKVTLYSERNYEGTTCKMEISPNIRQDLGSICPDFVKKKGISMEVKDFGYGGSQLCLNLLSDWGWLRCFKISPGLTGNFRVPYVATLTEYLPEGLTPVFVGLGDRGFDGVTYLY